MTVLWTSVEITVKGKPHTYAEDRAVTLVLIALGLELLLWG